MNDHNYPANTPLPNLPSIPGEDPFEAYVREQSTRYIVGRLLKFTKGDFLIGDSEVPLGTRVIVHVDSIMVGWIRWEQNTPQQYVMGPIKSGYRPPERSTLGYLDPDLWEADGSGEPRDPWQLSNYVVMRAADENDIAHSIPQRELSNDPNEEEFDDPERDLLTFPASSTGSRNAIRDFLKLFNGLKAMHPREWPIVSLGVGSYEHRIKSRGRIKFPIFKIVGWADKRVFENAAEEPQEEQLAPPPPPPPANSTASRKAAPRQAAPRQVAEAAPRQAAPRQVAEAAPQQAAPRQAAPRQTAPQQAAPRPRQPAATGRVRDDDIPF